MQSSASYLNCLTYVPYSCITDVYEALFAKLTHLLQIKMVGFQLQLLGMWDKNLEMFFDLE